MFCLSLVCIQRCVEILEAHRSDLHVQTCQVSDSGGFLAITLDRPCIMQTCISQLVSCEPGLAGLMQSLHDVKPEAAAGTKSVVVDVAAFHLLPLHAGNLSLDSLRVLVASQHLASTLMAQG